MNGRVQRRLVALAALAALTAILVPAGLALGNDELDAIVFLDCGDEAVGTPDAAAAAALAAEGFTCTKLFNKPTIDGSNPEQVGQLWFKADETILQMRVLFFSGGNTGFGDSKVCLDDDGNPINKVAPGGARAPTCVGFEASSGANQGGDGGPSYPPAKSADSNPEESNGKLELKIEGLTEVSQSYGGVIVGGWNVNLGPSTDDMYSEVLPHFNLGGKSIVGYFQVPGEQRILCGETITMEDGDLTASFTLEGIEGLENEDPNCFKLITTSIDDETGDVVFDPTGGGGEAGDAIFTGTISRANELIDMDPDVFGLDSVGLFIDTTSPFNFADGEPLEACVLQDGVYVPPEDGWGYTRSEAVPTHTQNGDVFGIETHDLCGRDSDPGWSFN